MCTIGTEYLIFNVFCLYIQIVVCVFAVTPVLKCNTTFIHVGFVRMLVPAYLLVYVMFFDI